MPLLLNSASGICCLLPTKHSLDYPVPVERGFPDIKRFYIQPPIQEVRSGPPMPQVDPVVLTLTNTICLVPRHNERDSSSTVPPVVPRALFRGYCHAPSLHDLELHPDLPLLPAQVHVWNSAPCTPGFYPLVVAVRWQVTLQQCPEGFLKSVQWSCDNCHTSNSSTAS